MPSRAPKAPPRIVSYHYGRGALLRSILEQVAPSGIRDSTDLSIFKALDPKVQERWRIQGELKNALLGYGILDLVEHAEKLVFGTWNPRSLQSKQVQRLVESFASDGVDRFDLKTVIPIVIPKSHVDSALLSLDPGDLSRLCALKLLPGGQGMSIKCAGGRHRVAALKDYIENIKRQHNDLVRQQDHISGISEEDISNEERHKIEKDVLCAIKNLQSILSSGGQWMVAVYDEGNPPRLVRSHCNS